MTIFLKFVSAGKLIAVSQLLILMAITFAIGWVLGSWLPKKSASKLNKTLGDRESELDFCHRVGKLPSALPESASKRVTAQDNLK